MEYMPGGSLSDRLERGPLSAAEAIKVLKRVGPALDFAHSQGVIHRDLKPGNILFDRHGNAFLADFGTARLIDVSGTLTRTRVIGTPAYTSPEQVRGDANVDGRSDIYSLGVLLFEMLTGRRPFQAESVTGLALAHLTEPVPLIREAKPDLPAGCEGVIARSMAKDRNDRFATAREMTKALATAMRGEALYRRVLVWILILVSLLVISAVLWGTVGPQSSAASLAVSESDTATPATGGDTESVSEGSDASRQPTSGATPFPTPNPTATPRPPGTPITTENVDQIVELARLGRGVIRHVALSPDGETLAIASTTGIWLFDADSLEFLDLLEGQAGPVQVVAWSPDGTKLASGNEDGIWIWQIATGVKLRAFDGNRILGGLAWSPDSSLLASGGRDRAVHVWNVNTGEELFALIQSDDVMSIAWSPNGTMFASGGRDDVVHIWRADSGEELLQLKGHTNDISSIAWSPDGERIASTSGDDTARVWNVFSREQLHLLEVGRFGVWSVAWSPDGTRLAMHVSSRVRVWDTTDWRELSSISNSNRRVEDYVWLPSSTHILSVSRYGVVNVWDVSGGGRTLGTLKGFEAPV
jgi:Tol biopolymer transport system component